MTMRSLLLPSLLFLALGAACRSDDFKGSECYSLTDCGEAQVCFLGSCVDPGYSISSVQAALTPPTDSPWLPEQTAKPLRLGDGLQSLTLTRPVTLTGTISSPSTPGLGGTLKATGDGSIFEIVQQTNVVDGAFSLRVLPEHYALRFTPATVRDALDPLPPHSLGTVSISSDGSKELAYPAGDDLVKLCGKLSRSAEVNTQVVGAEVSAVGHTPGGLALGSTRAFTAADGSFALLFPPAAVRFDVTVRPGTNPDVPQMTFEGLQLASTDCDVGTLVLHIEPQRTVGVRVMAPGGAPVANASLLFVGTVGSGDVTGSYVAEATTASSGDAAVSLIPGRYDVVVSPPPAEAGQALTVNTLEVTESSPSEVVKITVGTKVPLAGEVIAHDGTPVAGATLHLTLKGAPVPRSYKVITGEDGRYSVALDPSNGSSDAEYELVVEPGAQSGLPRHFARVRLDAGATSRDIRLYAPTFIYGEIHGPDGEPVPGVVIAFYSQDDVLVGPLGQPLLVGVAQSSAHGEFVIPLPTAGEIP